MTGVAPREGRRRVLHLASGVLGLAALAGTPLRIMTAVLVSLAVLALLAEVVRRRRPAANAALTRLSGGAFRPAEADAVSGATYLALGYAAAWLAFTGSAAALAIVVTAVADPSAAAVGRRFSAVSGRKTWAGTAAAFAAALAVLALAGRSWRVAGTAALVAALAERMPGRGLDNFAVPLATAAALWVQA